MKKSETTRAPKSRVIRAVAAFPSGVGSRRTAGFDGVRSKTWPSRPAGRTRGLDACCSVFKDRGDRCRGRPDRPDSHLRGPRHSGGPHAGASRASLRGRLHRLEVEEVRSQSGSCPTGRHEPPEGSREYTAAIPAVKAGAGRPDTVCRAPSPPARRRAKRRLPARITRPSSASAGRSSLGHRLAVQRHAAAGDQAPGLAARRAPRGRRPAAPAGARCPRRSRSRAPPPGPGGRARRG